jgi:hypothetical protein
MNNLSPADELARKDFLIALGIWLSLTFVSFVLFPTLQLIQPGDRATTWFYISIPLGLGGAFLLGASSRYIAITHETQPRNQRFFRVALSQLVGWLGLAGIGFPLVMVIIELFISILASFAGK